MAPERFRRYSTPEDSRRAAGLAGVDRDPWMQDWPLEVADPSRLAEFVDLLRVTDAEVPESGPGEGVAFELAELVLYSLDAAPPQDRDRFWPDVRTLLLGRPRRYAHHILYWSLGSERATDGVWVADPDWDTGEDAFAITPQMRSVLVEVCDQLGVRL